MDRDAVEFVIFGNGFLSAALQTALRNAGRRYVVTSVRIHDEAAVRRTLLEARPSVGAICAAGVAGKPNSGWCDDHRVETVESNILGPIVVADVCRDLSMRCGIFGSSCVFHHTDSNGNARVIRDNDTPFNPRTDNFYINCRIALERLFSSFPQVVHFRFAFATVLDPFDARGLLGKARCFDEVHESPVMVSVLEDLMPFVPVIMDDASVSGAINMCNPGHVNLVHLADTLAAHGFRRRDFATVDKTDRASYVVDPEFVESLATPHMPLPNAAERLHAAILARSSVAGTCDTCRNTCRISQVPQRSSSSNRDSDMRASTMRALLEEAIETCGLADVVEPAPPPMHAIENPMMVEVE